MRQLAPWLAVALTAVVAATAPPAAAQSLQPGVSATIEVRIPVAPVSFRGAGKTHIAYELHIANFQAAAITIEKIEVRGPAGALAVHKGRDFHGADGSCR